MSHDRARHAESAINLALRDTSVVIVNGAKQAGHTTLVGAVAEGHAESLQRQLTQPNQLLAARHDPAEFARHQGLLIVDGVQRAPELIVAIANTVERDNRPGQFLLTSSTRSFASRSPGAELRADSERIELWPLSQGEIDGSADRFVDAVFGDVRLQTAGRLARADYFERALRGGFPEAVMREPGRRGRFFEGYISDLIGHDIAHLGGVKRRHELGRLVRLLAGRMVSPLRIENVSNELHISKNTVERYVSILEECFLIERIGAWSNSATTRATSTRKLVFVDSGLAAHLAGFTTSRLGRDIDAASSLLTNFVLGELGRQITWCEALAHLYHYRTRDGDEVDAVIEHNDGRIVGVDVKASSSLAIEDFRHLNHLRDRTREQFALGVLLYTGADVLAFGDRMIAAPIDALWRTSVD